ncbi:response regulator [Novosphingobium album (ex Hu et al. 2023)]|uniref:Response regulator n=1 Tax=Novosphingobium album (ex Hu et al. 2023) TaxID=2930093 RepID=A0ABT0B3V8_9SPHN|nr:response regulator [Novosphingobium album (ex Hu et al. 2023)]MCJ2179568.1 response regulator [Novosphingobium album (ex Hu et al. 2023)]
MNARTVFVVEDNTKIAGVLRDYLHAEGYTARLFPDSRDVLVAARANPPAAILLDLMLPGTDGFTLCGALREFCAAPVLMLTARVDEIDRLRGLETGADDYICKPFSPREVMARIAAAIRRAEGRVIRDAAANAPYAIDSEQQRIAWAGEWLPLSPAEYAVLAALFGQPGRVFSRAQLLDRLGDRALESSDRAIDSHMKNIRRKITSVDPEARCIAAVYGMGYRFDPPTKS